jgi:hypothetical protein
MRRLLPPVLAACMLAAAIDPQPAQAHLSPGLVSASFRARIDGFRPPIAGVSASVLESDVKLRIVADPPHVVVVLGLVGEPFLRIGPDGTYANTHSPTAAAAGLITSAGAGPARWTRLSSDHAFAWHENRLRPQPIVSGRSRRVAGWTIPLLVDGRRVSLVGSEFYAAQPRRLLWSIPALAALAVALAALRSGRSRVIRTTAWAALVVAVTSWTASWIGVLLDGRGSVLWLALAAVYALSVAGMVAAAVTAPAGDRGRLIAIGVVGVLVATFALPELGVFQRGFVLSALPATVARSCVALAVGCGVGAAVMSVPATVETLRG